jgi:hypothetical protein
MENSLNDSNATQPLRLSILGLGHVPSIKNGMFKIVEPKNREWKRKCVARLVSQLLSGLPTNERGIPTPQSLQSLIASLPVDDNWKSIPETHIRCAKCEPGQEGAEILICPLQ